MTASRVAAAPCSWGVLELDVQGASRSGYEQVLDEMVAGGFEGTELGDYGFLPTSPAALAEAVSSRGLELVGAFVPVALANEAAHDAGLVRALTVGSLLSEAGAARPLVVLSDDNATVAERTASAGRVRPDQGLDEAAWAVVAQGVERIARHLAEVLGVATVFHHHCAGYVETPAEVETLLARTSPELLGLCLDTGHYAFGGGDPLEALDLYGTRVWHVHLKDFDPVVAARSASEGWGYVESVRQGVFCELGQGSVPFDAVLAALRTRGYEGWLVVEQDVLPGMGTPLESAKRSRAFLRGLGV